MKYVKSTKRSAFFILFLLVGLLLVSIAWALLQKSEKQNIIGVKAPTFQVTSFDNREINSKEYLGKVLVLNFLASWCDTCAEEAEMLEAVWKEYLPSKEVIFFRY
jgi:thiol-disulfide isomerase/thioredoxin